MTGNSEFVCACCRNMPYFDAPQRMLFEKRIICFLGFGDRSSKRSFLLRRIIFCNTIREMMSNNGFFCVLGCSNLFKCLNGLSFVEV